MNSAEWSPKDLTDTYIKTCDKLARELISDKHLRIGATIIAAINMADTYYDEMPDYTKLERYTDICAGMQLLMDALDAEEGYHMLRYLGIKFDKEHSRPWDEEEE